MTKTMSKALALLLSFSMVLSGFVMLGSLAVNAEDENGQVTEEVADSTATPLAASEATVETEGNDAAELGTAEVQVTEEDPHFYTGAKKARTMKTTIDMTKYPKGEVVRVWVPVPQSDENQTISNESFMAYKAKDARFTTSKKGEFTNKMFYVEWDKNAEPADRVAYLQFDAERVEVGYDNLFNNSYSSSARIPSDVYQYTDASSEYVKWDAPIVKAAVNKAFEEYAAYEEEHKQPTTTLQKAKAIYCWVVMNLERIDNKETLVNAKGESKTFEVIGCGYGDTVKILNDLETFGRAGGHCTDINSTFVAMCRNAGIPAREMFGIRLNDDNTTGQHCWAEFYLEGTGWVCADPGDVLKAIKGKNTGMTIDEVQAGRVASFNTDRGKNKTNLKYLFGAVDENRIVLSRGRDITLEPAQSATNGVYNTFGYPCAEHNGQRIECTDAKNFVYTIECKPAGTAPAIADGQQAVVDGATYKVTSASAMAAELVKAPNKKKVSVPESITVNGMKLAVTKVDAKAFKGKKIRKVTLGANVTSIAKNAFKGSKATKLVVKTKDLTKKSVKGSLKGSKIKTVQVKVGKKSENKKYVKKYKKYFTKKNAGKKVTVKR